MKLCGVCKKQYEESSFYKDKTKKDGLSWRCKQCDSVVAKEYRAKSEVPKLSRKKWTKNNPAKRYQQVKRLYDKVKAFQNIYKSIHPCECGEGDESCLEFHHIDQETLEQRVPCIHTFKKAIKEMVKCIILCANCHRKLHAGKISTQRIPPTIEELCKLLEEHFPEIFITWNKNFIEI